MLPLSGTRDVLYSRMAYSPPAWLNPFIPEAFIPRHRINLGQLPTPVHPLKLSHFDTDTADSSFSILNNFQFWLKRDDLSSFDLTGNKIRKLEFLLGNTNEQ